MLVSYGMVWWKVELDLHMRVGGGGDVQLLVKYLSVDCAPLVIYDILLLIATAHSVHLSGVIVFS